jgi:hypothetical protein
MSILKFFRPGNGLTENANPNIARGNSQPAESLVERALEDDTEHVVEDVIEDDTEDAAEDVVEIEDEIEHEDQQELVSVGWTCQRCTFANPPGDARSSLSDVCEMCSNRRPSGDIRSALQPRGTLRPRRSARPGSCGLFGLHRREISGRMSGKYKQACAQLALSRCSQLPVELCANSHIQQPNNSFESPHITDLQFDSDGVLLAASSTDGCVRLYDTDEINALNQSIQAERASERHQREQHPNAEVIEESSTGSELQSSAASKRTLEPFRCIETLGEVHSILWNPMDQNILASTRCCC